MRIVAALAPTISRQWGEADRRATITPVIAGLDPGLDPAIHPLRKNLMRRRWTRGSSPRVTTEGDGEQWIKSNYSLFATRYSLVLRLANDQKC